MKVTTSRIPHHLALGSNSPCVSSHLSQQTYGFQLLVDSESSEHSNDPELIRGVESKTLEYIRIQPPMKMTAAGDNALRGTAQGILLVIVRGTDDVLRVFKLPMLLVPDLKRT